MAVLFPMPVMYLDENADALAGGSILIEDAGTSDVASIFSDNTLLVPLANPYTLDGSGRAPQIWGNAASFKITVKDAAGVAKVGPVDNVPAVADAATLGSIDPWDVTSLQAGSANQFTVSADGIVSSSTQPRCLAYHNTTQSILSGAYTTLTMNSEAFDVGGMHDNATNPDRVTLPEAGVYLLLGTAFFAANATGHRGAKLRRNGATDLAGSQVIIDNAGGTAGAIVAIHALATFTATEYVQILGFQASGGALNTGSTDPSATNSLMAVKLW
jgi:hypothetical protein